MTTQNRKDKNYDSTVELLRATARGKLHKVIQAINEGAEVAVNQNGHTALHIACHKGFLDIVRILLSAGCDLDIEDDKGDTSLHRACVAGHDRIVRRLIDEGCSVDRQNQLGDTALHEGASRGYSRCVKALIAGRCNIGLKNKNLDTAIHLACANSHSGSLRLLLSSYPHSSPKNLQGDTPLHIAVRFGHVTCARVLISSRCNVNLQNKRGNTALHIATIARHRKLVRVLLDAGANAKTVLNNEAKSALDIAKDEDDGETAVMLLSGPRQYSSSKHRGRRHEKDDHHQRSQSEPRKQDMRRLQGRKGSLSSGSKYTELQRPLSATLPRKSYVQARAKWRRHERQKIERNQENENILEKQQHEMTVNPFVVPQLYSLYRDCHGNVRQQAVIDQLPNPTPEIVSSITSAVVNTKGELLQEMKKTNVLLEKRLDQLENHTDFKVAKLDQITKERINAERMQCLHRIDRRAMLERVVCGTCTENSRLKSPTQFAMHKKGSHSISPGENMHAQIGKNCNQTFMADGGIFSPDTGASVNSGYQSLQPYKTIKIVGSNDSESSKCCSSKKTESKYKNRVPVSLNYSDSAYGSLSPKPVLDYNLYGNKSSSIAGASLHVKKARDSDLFRHTANHKYHSTFHLPGNSLEQKFGCFSEEEPEVSTRVTQQLFENVTHAMEDWYERRLHDITARQQREMDQKVAELENKMKLLQSSMGKNYTNDLKNDNIV